MNTQIKDKLHFVSNGNVAITLHYGPIYVEKDAYRDLFYLPSIETAIITFLVRRYFIGFI